MGRHNKSNGRTIDPTYNYDRFAPSHAGPRPAYGRATKNPDMGHEGFKALLRTEPSAMPCGTVHNFGGFVGKTAEE